MSTLLYRASGGGGGGMTNLNDGRYCFSAVVCTERHVMKSFLWTIHLRLYNAWCIFANVLLLIRHATYTIHVLELPTLLHCIYYYNTYTAALLHHYTTTLPKLLKLLHYLHYFTTYTTTLSTLVHYLHFYYTSTPPTLLQYLLPTLLHYLHY